MQRQGKDEASATVPADQQGVEETARKMARLEAELAHAQDQTRRALADLENNRKRFDRERDRLREQDRAALLRDLLPVADNLERALAAAEAGTPISREGIEAVYRQLMGVLKRYGVEPMEEMGHPFDPAWHEVIGASQTGAAPNTITTVAERGYRLGERSLRPARVIVEKPENDSA
jgi:molecular chaperone GrpE